ncbi:MAG: ATP-binding protein [Chloroflexi bacterium]|nr:ATP-binding protein [Chloroflexota bacterium]
MVARKAQLEESLPWWQSAPWLREQGDGETPGGGQGQQGQQGQQEQQEQQGQQGQGVWAERPARRAFVRRLVVALDWGALVGDLAAHYARYGSGVFARYRAFRWIGPPETAARLVAEWPAGVAAGHSAAALHGDGAEWLAPVVAPDVVRPGDLVGYEPERALLRRNTVQFLRRYPANNVLLYGDRGTGKSSSVKALLNERSGGGGRSEPEADWEALRLIEVPKARLGDFPLLVSLLRGRPQRFILFVDDLSFEEGETHYKELKALLEGGLEARPANVVVYATSNRRHLVREHFSDRPSPDSEEVHARDTLQEKLSFADRFGITITFPTPDQASYLAIVEALARRSGIELEPAALRSRAIEWAAWHNGRSGRTARQFVDYLIGELGVASSQ